ncbi:hypothetical protein GmHk_17G049380 [Glycine max]|nr:hypothetical protein GmHk_17G049380 [Glycine max]
MLDVSNSRNISMKMLYFLSNNCFLILLKVILLRFVHGLMRLAILTTIIGATLYIMLTCRISSVTMNTAETVMILTNVNIGVLVEQYTTIQCNLNQLMKALHLNLTTIWQRHLCSCQILLGIFIRFSCPSSYLKPYKKQKLLLVYKVNMIFICVG